MGVRPGKYPDNNILWFNGYRKKRGGFAGYTYCNVAVCPTSTMLLVPILALLAHLMQYLECSYLCPPWKPGSMDQLTEHH